MLTIPDLVRKLSSFYHMLESRVDNGKKLLKLQGRLDLVLSQMEIKRYSSVPFQDGSPYLVIEENEEMDDDAQYEDMAHPSSKGNNTLRSMKGRVTSSTLEALGNEMNGMDVTNDEHLSLASEDEPMTVDDENMNSNEDDDSEDEEMSE